MMELDEKSGSPTLLQFILSCPKESLKTTNVNLLVALEEKSDDHQSREVFRNLCSTNAGAGWQIPVFSCGKLEENGLLASSVLKNYSFIIHSLRKDVPHYQCQTAAGQTHDRALKITGRT